MTTTATPIHAIFTHHQHNDQLRQVRGTINTTYTRKAGQNPGKPPYSYENMLLTDGQSTIKITLKDRPPFDQSLKGVPIVILAKDSAKGLTGIRVHDDSYTDPPTRTLMITPSATIQPMTSGGYAQPAPQPQQPAYGNPAGTYGDPAGAYTAPPPARPQRPAQPAPQSPTQGAANSFLGVRQTVAKMASLHNLCHKAAVYSYGEESELAIAATATLFIEAAKLRLWDACPYPPSAAQPTPPPEPPPPPPEPEPQPPPESYGPPDDGADPEIPF